MTLPWLERALIRVAPRWGLRRLRDRLAGDLLLRSFDAAAMTARTSYWRRTLGDGNTERRRDLVTTRALARNLLENNPYARAAMTAVVDHVVGWGITARYGASAFGTRWKAWTESTACDADGRLDFSGIQQQVMRTVFESGEILIRRRIRRVSDGLPIPLQLQLLEPDYLDHTKEGATESGGWIIQGVEFNPIGQRITYWLFPNHPGSSIPGVRGSGYSPSVPIPASEVLHIGEAGRPGQVRCTPWLAPVIPRLEDLGEYEDATLMKQKIAACLALILTDPDGGRVPLGLGDDSTIPGTDTLRPGMIASFPQGTAEVVQPPSVNEYAPYVSTGLRAIATGLGVSYEDLTGDFTQVNFSSARMSRLRHYDRVNAWRWRMLQPQFLDPVWSWAVQFARVVDGRVPETLPAAWTAPPMPMLEPDKEGLAYSRLIRNLLMSQSEALRELGYDPETVIAEIAADAKRLDRLGLISDSDPRVTTQGGQLQGQAVPEPAPAPTATPAPPPAPDDESAADRRLRELTADIIRQREQLARLEGQVDGAQRNGHKQDINVSVPIAPGAIQVPVDARSTTTIAEGAVRAGDVRVEAPVSVAPAEVRIEKGAVDVQAPVTLAPGAVTVPVTVADQVTVPAGRKRIKRDEKGRIKEIIDEGQAGQVVNLSRDADGRLDGAQP